MALDPYVFQTLEEQKALVLALDDSAVTESAKSVAFYSAMLDAAPEDPLDDPKEMEEMLTYLKKCLAEELDTYMSLVNDLM
jgi:hypothetical protein